MKYPQKQFKWGIYFSSWFRTTQPTVTWLSTSEPVLRQSWQWRECGTVGRGECEWRLRKRLDKDPTSDTDFFHQGPTF